MFHTAIRGMPINVSTSLGFVPRVVFFFPVFFLKNQFSGERGFELLKNQEPPKIKFIRTPTVLSASEKKGTRSAVI